MQSKTASFVIAATGIALLAGCGTHTTESNQSSAKAPVKSLPVSVQSKLLPLAKREHTVHSMPTKISAQNVLYISPTERYAIEQFAQVWPQLKNKPAVVWTGTTQAQAASMWTKEGYKADPLPSWRTEYVEQNMPTPDAYHEVSNNTWLEVPGVLAASEVGKWVSFFK